MARARAAKTKNDLWGTITPDTTWKGRTGRGVRVAIIDSGIDTEHPALKGKIKESVEAIQEGGRTVFRQSTAGDVAGHGTAFAGIITTGAPEAEAFNIKNPGPNASSFSQKFLA